MIEVYFREFAAAIALAVEAAVVLIVAIGAGEALFKTVQLIFTDRNETVALHVGESVLFPSMGQKLDAPTATLTTTRATFDGLILQTIDIGEARSRVGDRVALQGNLDPTALFAPPETIRDLVGKILDDYGPANGHIFNLGHGITPRANGKRKRIQQY